MMRFYSKSAFIVMAFYCSIAVSFAAEGGVKKLDAEKAEGGEINNSPARGVVKSDGLYGNRRPQKIVGVCSGDEFGNSLRCNLQGRLHEQPKEFVNTSIFGLYEDGWEVRLMTSSPQGGRFIFVFERPW